MPRKKKDKEKIETDKVFYDKVSLPLSAEKPIKSWYDIVSQDQSKVDSSKAFEIQQWVKSISHTLELLKAIHATIKASGFRASKHLRPSRLRYNFSTYF